MKKLLTRFFCTLGVIFFGILCTGAYLWWKDPFNIQPMLSASFSGEKTLEEMIQQSKAVLDTNPALSATQEAALRSVGVDPAKLPTSITPDMRDCFVRILSAERVAEITQGDTPSAIEIVKTKECYE